MKISTRLFWVSLLASLLVAVPVAHGQPYPARAIKMVVPFVPGGATDLVARAIGVEMSKTLGQTIVVENRPGNAGAVGADFVAKSAPDGYTLCLCTVGSLVTVPLINPATPYKPLEDLAPVSMVNRVELGLFARGNLPASNLSEVVALAKAAPGKYTFATTGADGPNYMAFKLFETRAGINLLHVPYKGDGQAVIALSGGEVDLFVGGLQSALPLMQSNRIKAIAMTGSARSEMAPNVPTVAESGYPGYEHSVWSGVAAPARTPTSIIARLQAAIAAAVQQPAVRTTLASQGLVPVGGTPEEFADVIRRDTAKYAEVLKRAGVEKK